MTEEVNRIGGFGAVTDDYDCTLLDVHVDLDLRGL